ncbi:MAG TPA: hypothetical protein DCE44_10975, partial [Verrucomicrobiales bacterium]|nr:hypothetical protein [Verrucomicrobiales bacterium]
LRGARIRDVNVLRARVIRPNSAKELRDTLIGQRFERVERRAKHLLFHLRGKRGASPTLLIGHLGMTGRMFLQKRRLPLPRHAAVTLDLGSDTFVFEDTRYFGRFHLDPRVLAELGPEPLNDEFSVDGFRSALRRSSRPIKVKLLDQSVVAGIGNIYASEALFRAGLSPRRSADRLRREEVARLHAAVRAVLTEAIDRGSTLPLDFAKGTDGLFYFGDSSGRTSAHNPEQLHVYDRAGQPCFTCETPIRQFVQAARSSYYCPSCQNVRRARGNSS